MEKIRIALSHDEALAMIAGLHIHLEKLDAPVPFAFEWGYTRISKKALAKKAPK